MLQMAEISLEAMRNSRRLLDDARMLASAQRFPTAFMVAGLAADELGKHIMVSSFFAREGTDDDWKRFWRRFRDHTEKLGGALLSAWAGDLLSEDPPPSSKAFHLKRLAATYVDLDDRGVVRTPVDAVSEADLEHTFESIDRELQHCESVLGNATPEQLAVVFDSMRSKAVNGHAAFIESLSAEALVALAVGARAGMPQDEAVRLASAIDAVATRGNQ